MKNTLIVILLGLLIVAAYLLSNRSSHMPASESRPSASSDIYYCPMHPQVTSGKPGECPICHMSLVKRSAEPPVAGAPKSEKKILYYRNPMNPEVTSPTPMKDEMGMDYIPVYEEPSSTGKAFYISPEKQQLIGVKTAKVETRLLTGNIYTVGRVAYDPDLYVAQQEYLQSVKAGTEAILSAAAKRKLLLMGMNEKEIAAMVAAGKPEQGLYLPGSDSPDVWVYATIYEYEAALIKEGQSIEVTAAAYPGQVFKGAVISIAPMVESMTRSLRVRARVDNPDGKLKLEMYVNATIAYDLGTKLAVPQEAVLNSGTHTYVFIADSQGYFQPRDVSLGSKVGGYYQVLSGLAAGDTVVTSGNFLIDSESKLSAAFSRSSEPNTVPQAGAK